jgi:hypothetical protein
MFVAIPLPYPPGRKLRCEVLDISSTGLAFKLARDAPYFLPGTPLREVAILGVPRRRRAPQVRAGHAHHPRQRRRRQHRLLKASASTSASPTTPSSKGARPRAAGEKRSASFVEKMGL